MKKKVLIVDDAMFMRKILKDIVEEDYEVVGEAANGLDALDLFKTLIPDILLIDITMPMLDGISTIKEIRKQNEKVKIIVCSALGHQGMVIEALEAGANDFIQKPFTAEKVKQTLKLFN